ncbi:DUF3108 domain-containing protein [uncultured Sunxiuqinia sp.]|uniref:DUF3108 domain-containing protein n=1 Tax=uncultured Sunxiuqinia sp. TaxID=1573825 RepID=UPI002AA6AB98|nr:DUF3108 domain-containing protein [uncultured Sunxiuqinia sp.]
MRRTKAKNHSALRAAIFSVLLFNAFLLNSRPGKAQAVFIPQEELTYGAYYNWHFIWINAGEVIFSTDTVRVNEKKMWRFLAIGKTYKAYDFFYTVRDTFSSRVNFSNFQPDYFIRKVNHAKSSTVHEYQFNDISRKIYSYVKREDQPFIHDTLVWEPTVSDMLSMVYDFRNFNFDGLKKSDQVNFKMLVDNKTEDLYFRYRGEEVVKTRNGRKFHCHHVIIRLLGGDFFPDGEYMNVWFTADQNRIPVKVETKILVGSVNAILTNVEHIKYPLTSEIH